MYERLYSDNNNILNSNNKVKEKKRKEKKIRSVILKNKKHMQ